MRRWREGEEWEGGREREGRGRGEAGREGEEGREGRRGGGEAPSFFFWGEPGNWLGYGHSGVTVKVKRGQQRMSGIKGGPN